MNVTRNPLSIARLSCPLLLAAAVTMLLAPPAGAAEVDLLMTQPGGDHWNMASGTGGDYWSDGLAPQAINTYFTQGFALRTPTGGTPAAFAGGSLTIESSGALYLKHDYNSTVDAGVLILDGGSINSAVGTTGGDLQLLTADIQVLSDSSFALGDTNRRRISLRNGTLSGSGKITVRSGNDINDLLQLETSLTSTHTGDWDITGGRLVVYGSHIGNSANVYIAAGAYLDVRGNEAIGSLTGAGTIRRGSSGTMTLTVGGNDTSTEFSGKIENGSGTMALTKTGTGTLTLSGNTSTYTGQTRVVQNGALRITSNNALGNTSGNTYIAGNSDNGGRVELVGGLTVAEPFQLSARQGATINMPHLLNVSGSNTLTGAITTGTGGSTFNLASDAGLLTIQGDFRETTSGNDTLQLLGAGDGLFTGDLLNNAGTASQDMLMIVKGGAGTWTLAGTTDTRDPDNGNPGTTTVTNGTLEVDGAMYSNLAVSSGATFGPGGSIGTADVTGNVSIDGILAIEINGPQTDLLNVTGDLDLSGPASVLDVAATSPSGAYVIATYTGALTGTFATETLPGGYSVDYGTGSNSQISLVPEPATIALAAMGLLGLRKRRRQAR